MGLTLAESKQVLHDLQRTVVEHQVAAFLEQQRPCPHCRKRRRLKDSADVPFRTLFGTVLVPNPRWHHCHCCRGYSCQCDCQPAEQHTFRPMSALLPERTSPELLYLETKWAALAPYGVTAKLLHEVLPIDHKHSPATVRNHLLRAAERCEQALGAEQGMFLGGSQAERDLLPIPDGPLSVGLDGGIVRARRGTLGEKATPEKTSNEKNKNEKTSQNEKAVKQSSNKQPSNLFEVIAGKSILSFHRDDPEDVPPSSKCFALVQGFDKKPRRRLYDLLHSQGMQANQQVTFFSDGGENVRRIPEYLNPDSEHILDWFHITMRITVLQQCARGVQCVRGLPRPMAAETDQSVAETDETSAETSLERRLESVKHYLWHGNVVMALERLQDIEVALDTWDDLDEHDPEEQQDTEELEETIGEKKPRPAADPVARMARSRMLKYVRELETYIANNARYIVNYGERYHNGERISTGFVESTINQVVSKRMVKKQQMQWTPRGAHLLLQVRTQVLNGDWEATFRTWYPQFRPTEDPARPLRMAA